MVKNLQRVPLYVSIHWLCVEMQERLIQKYQRWDHTGSIQKQQSADIWKRILKTGGRLTKKYSGKTTKTICSGKKKYLTTNQATARRDEKILCKKSNGKSSYSTIH